MSKKNMQLIKDKISGIFSGKSGKRNMYIAVASLMVIIFAVVIIITLNNSGNKDGEQQTISEDIIDTGDNLGNTEDSDTGERDLEDGHVENFVFPTEGERPIAVMIDNEGKIVLPQGGLDKAQIVYEIIVEGGITRYMPIFWGTDPELIGPVRSSRHYFLDYVLEHDAIYVHFGWSPQAISDISRFKINNINGVANGGEIFWDLTKDKNNWQDSYTSMEKIREYINKVKYRTTTDKKLVFTYNREDVILEGGIAAEKVEIMYNQQYTGDYVYDAESRQYLRYRNGEPHMERVSEQQLKVKNIIIQFAENYTIPGDKEGRQDVKTVGSGDGWFITCGKAIKIKWSKSSREEATLYVDEDGNPVVLNPGQTWIQIISPSAKVNIQ